uniref:UV-stimulated scaffold protein A n=1 Tax=Bos mutus grunniens TaxID=30521 RepID=A0A8B9Y2R8_BOSMU
MLGGRSASLRFLFLDMDQKLSELVEELTTSGEPQLNPEKMKQLKKICKSSEEQLGHAYHLLMAQLSQEHAEIRLSAFQVLDQLFARSHQFRTLVVSNFQEFLELTLGTDHERPLPPPREVAQRLRQAATQAIRGWNEKYGAAYKKLALGFHFLKHSKQVDFQDVDARTLAERKRAEERQKRLDRIYKERSEWAAREMEEMSTEIRGCLTELESCFRLLLPFDLDLAPGAAWCPVPEKGDRDEEQPCCSKSLAACAHRPGAVDAGGPPSEDEDSDPDGFVRRHGLGSRQYTLDVELSSDSLRVRENEDNSAVIRAARDALRLIQNKLLPAACSWVQLFTRAGTYGGHLEGAIHLKAELEAALKRSRELDIVPEEGRSGETAAPRDEDEDEDDFVEVPEKEGYEACVPEHLRPECGLEEGLAAPGSQARKRPGSDMEAFDPTSAAAQQQWPRPHGPPASPPSPRAPLAPEQAAWRVAEQARAPVVPFGVDLCYWGQEELMAGKILKCDSEHRFWKPCEVDAEVESASVSEALRSRRITFAGQFEPVQHRCRAPRPDGQLCARQDRLKCPFHGKIIPRDDAGRPLNAEDRAREQRQQLQRPAGRPDWQDPEFLRDVEAATGVDLGSSRPGGKGKGKRRKHSGLTDLKRQADTARARIAKKVFAKAAVQRVVTAMNQMDEKKHEKFANQFNYALN